MNGVWKKEVRSTHGKIFAWLGGAMACFCGIACAVLVVFAAYHGCYSYAVADYYDANSGAAVRSYAQNAWSWFENWYADKGVGTYDDSADFCFSVTSADTGKVMFSNEKHAETNYVGRLRVVVDGDTVRGYWYLPSDVQFTSPVSTWSYTKAEAMPYLEEYAASREESDGQVEIPVYGKADDTKTDLPDGTYEMNCFLPDEEDLTERDLRDGIAQFRFLSENRYYWLGGVAISAAVGIFCLVFLFCGAGRKRQDAENEPVHLCWFDRIPLEISFAVSALLACLYSWVFMLLRNSYPAARLAYAMLSDVDADCVVFAIFAAALGTGVVLFAMAWLLSFARWAKTGHAFQNSLLVRLGELIVRGFAAIGTVPKAGIAVGLIAVGNLLAYVLFGSYLGDTWLNLLFLFGILAWIVVFAVCLLLAQNIKQLQTAIGRIAAGDYETPVETKKLLPLFRPDAEALMHIRDGVNVAVERQIKSERLKTELITNVSHDLRTPLTNIINYTDLLQKQPLDETATEYAAVLAREGEKLKKLTEDLIDASKATSGAMPCHLAAASLSELCEQAIGEYAEKFAAAELEPVLSMPENGLFARIDGRLAWRVVDNLLGNACKYAQHGTRLYLTGEQQENRAVLTIKNISAAPLNTSADQLMERFVRGDAARTSEGSGLGLSIARSLTQLQGGSFTLTVDGDLFKAEMQFEACEPQASAL